MWPAGKTTQWGVRGAQGAGKWIKSTFWGESKASELVRAETSARNRTSHENYKAELRQKMEKPIVRDPKLKNIVDALYKPNARVGSGSTADAIRQEANTGARVGEKFHLQKGEDYRRGLIRWLESNPEASSADRAVAENLLKDLNDAMGYETRWYPTPKP